MVKVKICGIKSIDTLKTVIDCGADYCGFVFYSKSPRFVSLVDAIDIISKTDYNKINCVALFVNPSVEEIKKTIECGLFNSIQLHGNENISDINFWRHKWNNISWIKAIGVSKIEDISNLSRWNNIVDYLLLDSKPESSDRRPGGLAKTWSWKLLDKLDPDLSIPWLLAGGLNINNVTTAISISKAKFIDASSGLESSLGKKDNNLIKIFINKVKKF